MLAKNVYNQILRYNLGHRLEASDHVEYGYRDGGRHMQFDADGRPASKPYREIILVKNPDEDPDLKNVINTAKDHVRGMRSTREKVEFLNGYVAWLMKDYDTDGSETLLDNIVGRGRNGHKGAEISLGDLIRHQTGVCRHRALLLKVMGDACSVPIALVRGDFVGEDGDHYPHIWNEAQLENREKLVADPMHNFVGDMGNAKVKRYADINGKLLYNDKALKTPFYQAQQSPTAKIPANNAQASFPNIMMVGKQKWFDATNRDNEKAQYVRIDTMGAAERNTLERTLRTLGITFESKHTTINGGMNVLSVTDPQSIKQIKKAMDYHSIGNVAWFDGTDRNRNATKYLCIDNMPPVELTKIRNALEKLAIPCTERFSSINGGMNVIAVSEPKGLQMIENFRNGSTNNGSDPTFTIR